MKKFLLGLVIILVIFFSYEYQKPVITSRVALDKAIACLNSPPKDFQMEPKNISIDEIKTLEVSIREKSGFFNEVTNKREMDIGMYFIDGGDFTVTLNPYNGQCISITGPFH